MHEDRWPSLQAALYPLTRMSFTLPAGRCQTSFRVFTSTPDSVPHSGAMKGMPNGEFTSNPWAAYGAPSCDCRRACMGFCLDGTLNRPHFCGRTEVWSTSAPGRERTSRWQGLGRFIEGREGRLATQTVSAGAEAIDAAVGRELVGLATGSAHLRRPSVPAHTSLQVT